MDEKLSWDDIRRLYDRQWVELVDYEWLEGTPHPISGRVRVHAADRREFYRLMREQLPVPSDSALVFVGRPLSDPGVVHTNLFRLSGH